MANEKQKIRQKKADNRAYLQGEKLQPFCFQKSDLSFLVPCLFFLGLCSVLLHYQFNVSLEAMGTQAGTLIVKRNIALRKQHNQVFWEGTQNQFPLYSLDTVRTGENSSALINLNDKTQIDIDENTLIVISLTEEEGSEIDIESGSLRARRTSEDSDASELKIKSGDQTLSVKEGDLQIKKSSKQKTVAIAVNSGAANLTTLKKKGQVLKKDQKITVDKEGKVSVGKILFRLKEPRDGKHMVLEEKRKPVSFTWEKIEKRKNISAVLEISKNAGFSRIVSRKNIEGNSASAHLSSGSYYWRIFDSKSKETYSNIYKFEILKSSSVALQTPANKAKVSYAVNPRLVHFAWSASTLAKSYDIEIAGNRSFGTLLEKRNLKSTYTSFPLKAGKYFWRVRVRSTFQEAEKTTRSKSFTVIQKALKTLSIKLIDPNKGSVWQEKLKKKGLPLIWLDHPDFKEMRVQVSTNKNFKDKVIDEQVETSSYTIKKNLPAASYYWRIQGVRPKVKPSRLGSFKIIDSLKGRLTLLSPRKGSMLYSDLISKKGIQYAWRAKGIDLPYRLVVARDRKFKRIVLQKNSSTSKALVKKITRGGKYYWKIQAVDPDTGKVYSNSRVSHFSIAVLEEYLLNDGTKILGTSIGVKNGKLILKTRKGIRSVDFSELKAIEYDPKK